MTLLLLADRLFPARRTYLEEPTQLHQITERLGTDPLGKLLFRLSLPSVISMVTVSLYNLINTFWVARLGYEAVAAITVVMPFYYLGVALGVGTGVGANALISRYFGEKNPEAANHVTGQTFFLAIFGGGVLLVATVLFPYQILRLCGSTPDILEQAKTYLVILAGGMPLLFLNVINRNIFQASGDAVRPMIFTLSSQVLNAVLDPFFIFGWGFFPRLGLAGAAVATVISIGLSTSLSLIYLLGKKTSYRIKFRHCLPDLKVIAGIYRVGLPASVMEVTESVVFALFNNVVSGFGSVALAAIGIASRISDLAFMPIIGTAHGLLPVIGYSLGAKLWQRLWRAVRLSASTLFGMMLLATLLLEIFTPQTVALFNNDPELLKVAIPGMRIFVSTFALAGLSVIFITVFQGLSQGKSAMILSLFRQFFYFVPGLFLFSFLWGLTGVWICLPVSDTLGALTTSIWLYREYQIQKKKYHPSGLA